MVPGTTLTATKKVEQTMARAAANRVLWALVKRVMGQFLWYVFGDPTGLAGYARYIARGVPV